MTGVFDGVRPSSTSRGAWPDRWRRCCSPTTAPRSPGSSRPAAIRSPSCPAIAVWQRGKRRAVLDLRDATDRERVPRARRRADVVVESFAPGVADRARHRPRDAARDATRAWSTARSRRTATPASTPTGPAIDALVAARTGPALRGPGHGRRHDRPPLRHARDPPRARRARRCMSRRRPRRPAVQRPRRGSASPPRTSPRVGISAALHVRASSTGRGQHVHTSMLQGALATTVGRVARASSTPDATDFMSWVIDPRAPKGFFKGADGRWMHHWVAAAGVHPRRQRRDDARPDRGSPPRGHADAHRRSAPRTWSCCSTTSRSLAEHDGPLPVRRLGARRRRGRRAGAARCGRRRRRCSTRRCSPTAASSRSTTRAWAASARSGRVRMSACPTDAPRAVAAPARTRPRCAAEADAPARARHRGHRPRPPAPASRSPGSRARPRPRGRRPVRHADARRSRRRR